MIQDGTAEREEAARRGEEKRCRQGGRPRSWLEIGWEGEEAGVGGAVTLMQCSACLPHVTRIHLSGCPPGLIACSPCDSHAMQRLCCHCIPRLCLSCLLLPCPACRARPLLEHDHHHHQQPLPPPLPQQQQGLSTHAHANANEQSVLFVFQGVDVVWHIRTLRAHGTREKWADRQRAGASEVHLMDINGDGCHQAGTPT
jgi:hypothetical protein